MKKCVVVGAGTYGQVYAEYLKKEYDIIGFVDDNVTLIDKTINGVKVLGDFKYLINNIEKDVFVFVPIGNNMIKETFLKKLWAEGFKTPNYIHPTANIDPSVKIADNAVYILQNTTIMPLSELKEGVMISAGSIVSHHSTIESNVFISFGVNVGASLRIKERAYIGIGATIMTGVKEIGKDTLIGAGAVVIREVPDNAVVVGNPGKIIKYNQ